MLRDRLSRDIECQVLTSYHPDKPLVSRSEEGDVYRVIPRFRSLPRLIRFFLEVPIAALVCLLLSTQIDIVHTHSTSLSVLGVVFATSLTRTPLAYDCRDEGFPSWLITRGSPVAWFSCAPNIDDHLIASGVDSREIVRLDVTNPPFVADFVPESVDKKHIKSKISVIYVGRLNEAKGAHIAVESFLQATESLDDAHLEIVGDGALKPQLRESVEKYGATDSVNFHGEVPHRDAVRLISESNILLLPSKSEGIPRVILEAFEVGTTVISTSVGGIPTLIEDGITGLFAQRTVDDFSTKIDDLGKDQYRRVEFATEAQQVIQDRHSWNTIEKRLRQSYADAIGKHE
jgi:glycosyltransferase involved in cell wall biosynthesis